MDDNMGITDLQSTDSSSNLGKRKRESEIDALDTDPPTTAATVSVTEHDFHGLDEKAMLSPQIIECNVLESSLQIGSNLSDAQGTFDTARYCPVDNDAAVDSKGNEIGQAIAGRLQSLSNSLVGSENTTAIASINAPLTSEEGEQVETPIIRGLVSEYFSLNGPDRSFSGGARFPGDLLDVHKQWRKKYFYEQTTYYSLNEAYECPYGWMYTRFEITDNWKDNGTNGKGSITFSGDSRKAYLVIDGLPRKGVDWSIKLWKTKV